METKRIGDTLLAWMPIADHEPGRRRAAEQQAVAQLLRELGHDSAALGHTPEGAPTLPGCHISISHSRRLAIAALNAERAIGIDAEEERATLRKVKQKFVSAAEEKWAADADLLRLWTVKEAVYKAAATRGLAFTAIDTSPTWATASANGLTYDLIFLQLGETMVCLSTKTG